MKKIRYPVLHAFGVAIRYYWQRANQAIDRCIVKMWRALCH